MFLYVLYCFVLTWALTGQLSHFPLCFGAGVTNLTEPPSSFCFSAGDEQKSVFVI